MAREQDYINTRNLNRSQLSETQYPAVVGIAGDPLEDSTSIYIAEIVSYDTGIVFNANIHINGEQTSTLPSTKRLALVNFNVGTDDPNDFIGLKVMCVEAYDVTNSVPYFESDYTLGAVTPRITVSYDGVAEEFTVILQFRVIAYFNRLQVADDTSDAERIVGDVQSSENIKYATWIFNKPTSNTRLYMYLSTASGVEWLGSLTTTDINTQNDKIVSARTNRLEPHVILILNSDGSYSITGINDFDIPEIIYSLAENLNQQITPFLTAGIYSGKFETNFGNYTLPVSTSENITLWSDFILRGDNTTLPESYTHPIMKVGNYTTDSSGNVTTCNFDVSQDFFNIIKNPPAVSTYFNVSTQRYHTQIKCKYVVPVYNDDSVSFVKLLNRETTAFFEYDKPTVNATVDYYLYANPDENILQPLIFGKTNNITMNIGENIDNDSVDKHYMYLFSHTYASSGLSRAPEVEWLEDTINMPPNLLADGQYTFNVDYDPLELRFRVHPQGRYNVGGEYEELDILKSDLAVGGNEIKVYISTAGTIKLYHWKPFGTKPTDILEESNTAIVEFGYDSVNNVITYIEERHFNWFKFLSDQVASSVGNISGGINATINYEKAGGGSSGTMIFTNGLLTSAT